MQMIEILKSLEHLPVETIEVMQAIMAMGVFIYLLSWFVASIVMGLYELVCDTGRRRKYFKFLSDEDIVILNDYLEKDLSCFEIGEIVKTAYKKEEALRRIRKGWWKKLWKKDKEQ